MALFDTIRAGASGAASEFTVDRSLRFNDDDSAYLSRTPSSAGNRRTFTWSGWIKRSKLDASDNAHVFFDSRDGASQTIECTFGFLTNDTFYFDVTGAGIRTNALFRDVSAWQHWVIAVDTTQASSSNRVKIYVNGSQITSFSSANYPSQNYDTAINAQYLHSIGRYNNGGHHDGYMAEINFIDGQQLTPASFAETNTDTGQWNPIDTSGLTFGTNGFRLKFADNSGTSATTLGKDTSGNSNNFTPNNFSVAAGSGNDSLEDTPTNNFCTLNSVKQDSNTTLSEGNLKAAGSSSTDYNTNTQGTFAQSSGKWYYEAVCDSTGVSNGLSMIGWAVTTLRSSDNPTGANAAVGYRPNKGDYIDFSGNNLTGKPTTSTGTVIQIAIDFDAGKIWFGSGGTYFESGDPSAGSNEARTFTAGTELAPVVRTLSATYTFNFGQRPFSYTVPTGFKALNSANLPDPTIALPTDHFDTLLYTGNTGSQNITGLDFDPDWVWAKSRSTTGYHHELYDTVRGDNLRIFSSQNNNELTGYLQFGQTGGFSLTAGGGINISGQNLVAWCWNAGGSTVSNSSGSITSQVRTSATAGVSIVTYTGNGTNPATIGHGLGVAADVLLIKNRSNSFDWRVFHHENTSAPETDFLCLNTNAATQDRGDFNDTLPTSTVFSVKAFDEVNNNNQNYVAYCFSEVAGYSKFGSYTGNGSTDGSFVFTGFRPAYILLKRTNSAAAWIVHDNKRAGYNGDNDYLQPDDATADSDGSSGTLDILSNGFKLRMTAGTHNGSGDTYIYLAFAEAPFKYARAR